MATMQAAVAAPASGRAAALLGNQRAAAAAPRPPSMSAHRRPSVAAQASAKTAAKAAAMVCVDCGYLYDGKKGAFAALPGTYRCPVCSADKKRFKAFEGNTSKSNDVRTMEKRAEQLREQLAAKGEDVGEDTSFLVISGGFALAVLGAAYYFAVVARQ